MKKPEEKKEFVFISNFQGVNPALFTGGKKRYLELYNSIKCKGNDTLLLTNVFKKIFSNFNKICKDKRTIYIIFDERYLFVSIFYSLFTGGIIIMMPRGDKLRHDYKSSRLRKYLKLKIIITLYKWVDLMIFQTYTQSRQFKKKYKLKIPIDVVYNNINTSWIEDLKRKSNGSSTKRQNGTIEDLKIGFLGGNDPRKGFDIAVLAASRLKKMGTDINLICAGRFDNEFIKKEKYINVVGYLEDTTEFWNDIDVLWVPSRYDSFPNVCLEAIAQKKPFLISRDDISEEIFDDIFLSNRSARGFANATIQMIENNSECLLSRKLGELYSFYTFDWGGEVIEKIDKYFREVMINS